MIVALSYLPRLKKGPTPKRAHATSERAHSIYERAKARSGRYHIMPEKERAHTSHNRARSGAEMALGRSARACKIPERAHTTHARAFSLGQPKGITRGAAPVSCVYRCFWAGPVEPSSCLSHCPSESLSGREAGHDKLGYCKHAFVPNFGCSG